MLLRGDHEIWLVYLLEIHCNYTGSWLPSFYNSIDNGKYIQKVIGIFIAGRCRNHDSESKDFFSSNSVGTDFVK